MNRNSRFRIMMNARGFSLTELIVAMAILLFVSLVMAQTAIVSIDSNARNGLRDEATRVAEEVMNEKLRNLTVDERNDLITAGTQTEPYLRNFRQQDITYTAIWNVTDLPASEYDLVKVAVRWNWRGENYQVETSSLME